MRLPDFPPEFWYEEVFAQIEDTIGEYLLTLHRTLECKSTSYACICIQLDLHSPLPTQVSITFLDEDLVLDQMVDYENIPFKCRVCVIYGHLIGSYPHATMP